MWNSVRSSRRRRIFSRLSGGKPVALARVCRCAASNFMFVYDLRRAARVFPAPSLSRLAPSDFRDACSRGRRRRVAGGGETFLAQHGERTVCPRVDPGEIAVESIATVSGAAPGIPAPRQNQKTETWRVIDRVLRPLRCNRERANNLRRIVWSALQFWSRQTALPTVV